jgi:hypothetical protein
MDKSVLTLSAAIISFGSLITVAQADFFSDVAKVVTAPITAPVEATKRLLEGDDPAKVITRPIQAGGRVIQQTVQTADVVKDQVLNVPREAIRNTLGEDWERGFDTLTALQRVQFEMQLTSGRFLGGCLQGQQCDVQAISAMPVAASMRDAYKVYVSYSVPLHPGVQQQVSVVVPGGLLGYSRIAVGNVPDFTVPGFLNAANSTIGNDHAVTLGNLMIFSRWPDLTNCSDIDWLLHELYHVNQYSRYSANVLESIDGFAVDYVGHFNSMEEDARNNASSDLVQLQNYYGFSCGN